ncbi:uncharacterized protein LOC120269339 isoform X1 [Dioscorea cayenensis subsp. rotundata]|uniref:Uncharacterized protein LOC120269339 isoform X1 n=1 Tax=Dioscorea cayennensis subsp. rotundata TaxID=55577 RepID=A0AB40C147_DIOCR|nr:uncharacterized protein LOC120269339 isoform X1 [Dioscorea cayenensis subsp. rotundata]
MDEEPPPPSAPASPASSQCANYPPRPRHIRSNSFQRWKRQVQRAWWWGSNAASREQGLKASVHLEMMANQKRQWYQIQSKTRDSRHHEEPTSLFEHFLIVGLHSCANVQVIEDAFARRKNWESEAANSEIFDLRKIEYHGHPPALEPQILFKYPPGKRLAMTEKDLPAFCFPGGVKARLLEKTPSMSDLNEVVFGQEHLARDGSSFIFSFKVSDSTTLYGVCLHVQELLQRAPGILGAISPLTQSSSKSGRCLVSAPRCYCLLTRVPFFELHFEMLNSIIAQERLDRVTQYVSEMVVTNSVPRVVVENDQLDENFDSPDGESYSNWMDYAIPVDSVGLTPFAANVVEDKETPPFPCKLYESPSPESTSVSDTSDFGHVKDVDKDMNKAWQHCDDCASESTGSCSDSFEQVCGSCEYSHTSPESSRLQCSPCRRLLRVGSLECIYRRSARDVGPDFADEELYVKYDANAVNQKVMEWAKAHENESLQTLCAYHALPIPSRGEEIIFHPLEHLQPIKYSRPGLVKLGVEGASCDQPSCPAEANFVNARLAAVEEALSLSIWTVATVCRALSLESVLSLFAGALLEKQMVVICPNLGVLSATVLSIIPMLRPFAWQSLLLPVLPRKMLEFLDAPVPFIVGIQHKPKDMKMKTANLIRINVQKDQVKSCSLPPLPQHKELMSELRPIHTRLMCENSIAKRHPVYKCSEVQAESAGNFLDVTRRYLESLCSNLRAHTITNVQSNDDKVSLLLKDSFIDSFPSRDQPFIKLFVDTQLFSVLSDSRLSRYEHE